MSYTKNQKAANYSLIIMESIVVESIVKPSQSTLDMYQFETFNAVKAMGGHYVECREAVEMSMQLLSTLSLHSIGLALNVIRSLKEMMYNDCQPSDISTSIDELIGMLRPYDRIQIKSAIEKFLIAFIDNDANELTYL